MRTACALLNLIIAAGYVQFLTFLLLDARRTRRLSSTGGLPMAGIFMTCGLHHLVHGLHELMGEIARPSGWELFTSLVQVPLVLAWGWLRWEKERGHRGDRRLILTRGRQRALDAAWGAYALTVAVGTLVQSHAVHGLQQGLAHGNAALPNLLIAGMYTAIGHRVLVTQRQGERDYWSLSGLLISGYFANCGLGHFVVASELLGGRYALDEWHMLLVDWLGVLPAFWFLAGEGILAYTRGQSPRGPRRSKLLPATVLAVLGLQGVLIYQSATATRPFDPLDDPRQIVLNRVTGVTGPAVHLGDDLDITGVKCNSASVPVSVVGSMAWMSVTPAGTVIPVGQGAGVRAPGCTTFRYVNPMPNEVMRRTRALFAQGLTRVQWRIAGVETPARAGGVPEVWTTEPFTVIP